MAGEAGFRRIEVMVDRRPESQDADALSEMADVYGMEICSIHAPFLLASRKVWGRPLEKIERSMEMARRLGAGLVVLHLPYFWQVEYARWLYHNLNALNRSQDLVLAVENAIYVNVGRRINLSFFNDLEELSKFDDIVLDTSHFAISHTDIFHAWNALRKKVRHVHLSNNYLKGFDDHELPQQGNLPLDRFLATLARDGFDGCVVLELNPGSLDEKSGKSGVIERLRETLEFCRENFA